MKHARAISWTMAVVIFALVLGGEARAQSEDEPAARALFKEGLALHEAKDFAGALEKYRAAYARWKNPKILANIGTVAWELGRFVEAAEAYDQYLVDAPANDASHPEVEKALADVLPKVGTLVVEAAPAAQIRVDARSIEHGRRDRIRVEPGSHSVEASSSGSAPLKKTVDVAAGATIKVSLLETTPAVATSSASAPSADVQTSAPPKNKLAWVIGGVGATSLLASGVFYLMHNSAKSSLDDQCIDGICPSTSGDDIDSAERFGTLSLLTLGIGVAGVGTAVVMLAGKSSDAEAPSAARLDLRLRAGPSSASAAATFRF